MKVFLPYGGMAPLGRRPFLRMMPKEIACLFRRVIRRLSACRRVYILMGKRKAPFLCSEYGLHLLSVRRTNGVKDMEKASVYTGWNISPAYLINGIDKANSFGFGSCTCIHFSSSYC